MGVKAWSVVTVSRCALLAVLVWSIFAGSALATFVVLGFVRAVRGAALVWRLVLGARRSIPVSRTLAPGLQGLGDGAGHVPGTPGGPAR